MGWGLVLIVPALLLALMGWLVPRLLARAWPEGVWPLMGLALASAALMMLLGAGLFAALYAWQGYPLGLVFEEGAGAGLRHFARLAAISALLWAPLMILSVASLPGRWTRVTW